MSLQFIKNWFKKQSPEVNNYEYKIPTITSVKSYAPPKKFEKPNLNNVKDAVEDWHRVVYKYSDFGTEDNNIQRQFQDALRNYIDIGTIDIPKNKEWNLQKSEISTTNAGTEMSGALLYLITTIGKSRNNQIEFEKVVDYLKSEVLWKY